MGLFSDTCQSLIDPATKRALTGQALADVRKSPEKERSWPRCGNKVKKAARFCGRCGTGAPGGWWKCASCGKWVGTESNFCWNCKSPLHPESRDLIAGGTWQKTAGVFAERIEIGDAKKVLSTGLIVQEGTGALLLDNGAYRQLLGPGRHEPGKLSQSSGWFGAAGTASVILVDNGDVVLPLRLAGIRTSEGIEVELYTEVAMHLVEKGAANFVSNLVQQSQQVSFADLAKKLSGELRYSIDNFCAKTPVDELFRNPERRVLLENELQASLKTGLERYGLEILRVATVEFSGQAYEEMRNKSAEIELKRRELEYGIRMREVLQGDHMAQFKSEHDLKEYATQLAHERDVSAAHRDEELSMLRLVQRGELDAKSAQLAMTQAMEKTAHDIGVKLKWDEYANQAMVTRAESEAAVARTWMKVRDEKARMKIEVERERMKAYEGVSDLTRLMLVEDPQMRADLLEAMRMAQSAGKSPLEILAMAAAKSPHAAEALKAMSTNDRAAMEKQFDELKRALEDNAGRSERIMKSAMETSAEVAKKQAQIIT